MIRVEVRFDAVQLRARFGARGDAGHLGLRPHRPARRSLRAGLRHAGGDLGSGRRGCSKARSDGFQVAASREALFEQADVLSVHLRLNDETRGLVGLDDLMRMKPTALFVNTSRAELVGPTRCWRH